MTPTPVLRVALREMLEEQIPPGGTEQATLFRDAELDRLLEQVNAVEEAAYRGWVRKAIRVYRPGTLVSARIGNESYQWVSPSEARKAALEMADFYRALVPPGLAVGSRGVSMIMAPEHVPVLRRRGRFSQDDGDELPSCSNDTSRLWTR